MFFAAKNDFVCLRPFGGLSTKIHATVDALGTPTGFRLTPGQAHGLKGADTLLKDTPAQTFIADTAYDAHARLIAPLLDKGKARGDSFTGDEQAEIGVGF